MKITHIPVQVDFSMPDDPRDHLGWASAETCEDGTAKIEIILNSEAAIRLENLVELLDIYAIGFAGIRRMPNKKES